MKRNALCVPAVLLLGLTLLACGAAPASVSPVQNNAGNAPTRATDAPAVPTPPEATLPPQPAPTADVVVAPAATLGQPFELARGQSMPVAGTDLTLTFADVTEDSRCPRGVDCAWAGQVIVVLDVAQSSQATSPLMLTLEGTGHQVNDSRAQLGMLTVQIEAVAPYPEIGSTIAPDDYVATLRVE